MSVPALAVYSPEDQQAFARLVIDIHAEFGFAFDPELDQDLSDPEAHYAHTWVLKADGQIVGSVALTAPANGTTTLKRMYLRPRARGHGWGRRLLSAALEQAARDGCHRIELDTTDRQQRAIHVYESAGFCLERRTGETRHYALVIPA